jgi:hypothetical protein
MKDNRPPKEERTLKRGDVREDGMVFYGYNVGCQDGERWVTGDYLSQWKARAARKKREAKRREDSWESKNRGKRRAYARNYYHGNKEKAQKSNVRWKRNNSDKVSAMSAKRRKNIPRGLRLSEEHGLEILEIYEMRNMLNEAARGAGAIQFGANNYGRYAFCVDHVLPVAHSNFCGLHVPWNLNIIDAKENMTKSNSFEYHKDFGLTTRFYEPAL